MATTDVDICSSALNRLGEAAISSLSDGTDRATICNNVYANLRDYILDAHDWYCSIKRKKLTEADTAPVNEWDNQFLLPSDCKMLRAVYDTASTGNPTAFKRWELVGKYIQTNADPIWIEYTKELSEGDFPDFLVELMVTALCAEIAMAITDQANLAAQWARHAWGPSGVKGSSGGMFRSAKRIDKKSRPTKAVEDYGLTAVRG